MLKNKVAIVTGGTRGIGFEIVRLFKENGAQVVLLGSREETVNKAVKTLAEEGMEVEGYFPNLSSYDEVKQVADKIAEKYGKIDILVNNAGISASKIIDNTTSEDFSKIIDLNQW